MKDKNNPQTDEFEEEFEGKSKTQLKQEMTELQELGLSLTKMKASQLDELPLTAELRFALDETLRIKHKNALRRHTQFIGKLMRSIDIDTLNEAMQQQQERNHRSAKHKPYIEQWTTQLLETPDALQQFIEQYPQANIQKIRQHIRQTQKEKQPEKKATQRQKLFKAVREALAENQT